MPSGASSSLPPDGPRPWTNPAEYVPYQHPPYPRGPDFEPRTVSTQPPYTEFRRAAYGTNAAPAEMQAAAQQATTRRVPPLSQFQQEQAPASRMQNVQATSSAFEQVAGFRSLFSQGPADNAAQTTARTEARTNLGNLLATTQVPRHMPAARNPAEDSTTQMSRLQQLRAENEQLRLARQATLGTAVEQLRLARQATTGIATPTTAPVAQAVAAEAPEAASERSGVTVWEGNEYTCSVCLEDMVEHDRVCRLACRHVFHTTCWAQLQGHDVECCPNCRAGTTVTAIWHFIGDRPDPSQGQPNLLNVGTISGEVELTGMTTPRSVVTEYDFGTPDSSVSRTRLYPVFPATNADAEEWQSSMTLANQPQTATVEGGSQAFSYISNTELADGRQALLIDPGSWHNLTGSPWARRTAVLASRHNRPSKQTERARPLNVSGVGKDAQQCTHDCELPIELKTIDGRSLSGTFKAPTINGHALPALLGLRTLIERRAVMDFTTMTISFTGPGATKIEYSPGTDTFQMLQAPSGHLMLPCCEYKPQGRRGQEAVPSQSDLSLLSSEVSASTQASSSSFQGPPRLGERGSGPKGRAAAAAEQNSR